MRLRLSIVVFACLVAAACGGQSGLTSLNSHQTLTQAGPALKTPGPGLFVADTANNAVDAFQSTDNGNVAPTSAISGVDTGLSSPHGVAVGADGSIYVANDGGSGSITVYGPGSSGDAVPIRTMTCGGLSTPAGIALDHAGNLFVANSTGKSISVFSPTDTGCVAGNRVIKGIHTCLFEPQDVDLRSDGVIYVASSSAVLVFRATAHGDAQPIQKITGSNTQLFPHVNGVSLDSALNIYATSASVHNQARVTVYAPAATGNVAPIRMISGAATTLNSADKIEIDPTDQAFVTSGAAVDVFAAGASGNVAPVQTITGSATTLVSPAGLDLSQ
jgi:NHL repeat-containing protein